MKRINTVDDFFRFIDDSTELGYKVCLKGTSFQKEWTAGHLLEHIWNIHEHCKETKIELTCESVELGGRVIDVTISERHPTNGDEPAKNEWSLWTVRYRK